MTVPIVLAFVRQGLLFGPQGNPEPSIILSVLRDQPKDVVWIFERETPELFGHLRRVSVVVGYSEDQLARYLRHPRQKPHLLAGVTGAQTAGSKRAACSRRFVIAPEAASCSSCNLALHSKCVGSRIKSRSVNCVYGSRLPNPFAHPSHFSPLRYGADWKHDERLKENALMKFTKWVVERIEECRPGAASACPAPKTIQTLAESVHAIRQGNGWSQQIFGMGVEKIEPEGRVTVETALLDALREWKHYFESQGDAASLLTIDKAARALDVVDLQVTKRSPLRCDPLGTRDGLSADWLQRLSRLDAAVAEGQLPRNDKIDVSYTRRTPLAAKLERRSGPKEQFAKLEVGPADDVRLYEFALRYEVDEKKAFPREIAALISASNGITLDGVPVLYPIKHWIRGGPSSRHAEIEIGRGGYVEGELTLSLPHEGGMLEGEVVDRAGDYFIRGRYANIAAFLDAMFESRHPAAAKPAADRGERRLDGARLVNLREKLHQLRGAQLRAAQRDPADGVSSSPASSADLADEDYVSVSLSSEGESFEAEELADVAATLLDIGVEGVEGDAAWITTGSNVTGKDRILVEQTSEDLITFSIDVLVAQPLLVAELCVEIATSLLDLFGGELLSADDETFDASVFYGTLRDIAEKAS